MPANLDSIGVVGVGAIVPEMKWRASLMMTSISFVCGSCGPGRVRHILRSLPSNALENLHSDNLEMTIRRSKRLCAITSFQARSQSLR